MISTLSAMSASSDILIEIPLKQYGKLKDIYKKNWPYYCYIHYFIDLVQKWKIKYNYENLKFYCINGNFDDGTFVAIGKDQGIKVKCFTTATNDEILKNGLLKTGLIDWSQLVNFDILHKDQFRSCFDLCREKNKNLKFIELAGYWWLPKEKAINFQIVLPDGTYLDKLNIEHAKQMYNVWTHKNSSRITYIETLVRYNGGVGLFDTNTNELMAWMTRNDYGCLAILHTEEKHRRKGYGEIVAKALCKQFAEDGLDSVAFIIIGNNVSETLFKKLNFQLVNYFCWTQFGPA